jgi:hypothetical protein
MPNVTPQISGHTFSPTPLEVTQKSLPTSKYRDLPTAAEINQQARAAPIPNDLAVLELVQPYHAARSTFAKHYMLAKLHRPAHNWLIAARNGTAKQKTREPEIFEIYKLIVLKLCSFFHCSTSELPTRLEQDWLAMHEEARHAGEERSYLDEAAREQYRLVIDKGLIYRYHDTFGGSYKLANTADGDLLGQSFLDKRDVEGDAGYVQSLWNSIYMAKHDGGAYHSQYMSGNQVACAGGMTIQGGTLRLVSNSSGHYRPSSAVLVPLLFHLRTRMVPLTGVTVSAFDTGDNDTIFVTQCDAMHFLITGGKPNRIQAHYIETQGLQRIYPVSGRVSFSDGREIEDMTIRFSKTVYQGYYAGNATTTFEAKLAPDGSFALETEVIKAQQKRLRGVLPGNNFNVTIVGAGANPPKWTLPDKKNINAGNNFFDLQVAVPPAAR